MLRINKDKTRVERLKSFLLEPKDWTFGFQLILIFIAGLILVDAIISLIMSKGFFAGISAIIIATVKFILMVLFMFMTALTIAIILGLLVTIPVNIMINIYTILKSKIKK